jgi:hypothetical protein
LTVIEEHVAEPHGRSVATAQQELLARLSEPGLDLDAARAALVARRRRGELTRRAIGGSIGVLVVALLLTGLVLRRGDEPDELVADRDEQDVGTTTTSLVPDTTIDPLALAPVTAAPTTAAPTTVAPVATAPVVAETTVAPPVTLPPNQPLQASATVLTPTVEAGAVVTVALAWSDQDLGSAPRHVVAWGDPLLSTPVDTSPIAPCDAPGSPASGVDTLQFRYSTPGTYLVRVTLETCGASGAYGERVALDADVPITVTAPTFVDADDPTLVARGQSVVVFQPPRADGVAWPALEAALAALVPQTVPTTPVPLVVGPGPIVYTTSGPAMVLVVPEGATGAITLRWPDGPSCASTVTGDLVDPEGRVPSLPLTPSSC